MRGVREGSEGQSHKEDERNGENGTGEEAKSLIYREAGLYLNMYAGAPSF